MIPTASVNGRTATAHRSIPVSVPSGTFRQSLLVLTLLGACLPQVQAALPNSAVLDNNALYKKGYLDVTLYKTANGTPPSEVVTNSATPTTAQIAATTLGLNQAIKDAYAANLALYFPSGTYVVNDTLKAHTATGVPQQYDSNGNPVGSGSFFAVPRKHLVMIGSTSAARPIIKLVPANGDSNFALSNSPRPVLEFKNLNADNPLVEDASTGFFQMLRGIDIDCGPNVGAIGLYFNQAQNSSIENVKITATGAHTGIRGLPSRGWGAVNVEIEGGQYGIDTKDLGNPGAGTVIAGATFRNQTVSAVRHTDFVPMVIVGFEITTSSPTQDALTIESSYPVASSNLALIDGKITLGGNLGIAAINNTAGQSIYVRNVHIWGTNNLIQSGTALLSETTSGSWRHIKEYSYRDEFPSETVPAPLGSDPIPRTAKTFVDGVIGHTTQPLPSVVTGAAPPDLVTRHRWLALPSVDDPDAVNVIDHGIIPGTDSDTRLVDSTALQAIIDAPGNRKIFLPKGIYRLTEPGITLRADTILFGAARNLTRIETDPSWTIDKETPIIKTDANADATTYLGDLTIGVNTAELATDFFTALNWKAGRSSMVHMGQPYRFPYEGNSRPTQDHSLLKIEGTGGGRWYFAGSIKTGHAENAGYRILEVRGTRQPLWFYGLNLEHAIGCATFSEFNNAQNIRIYGVKSEFLNGGGLGVADTVVLRFSNVKNVAQFGHGAIRNAVKNHGCIEFDGNSNGVLAALISPQNNRDGSDLTGNDYTVRENWNASSPSIAGVAYPNCVALFKRGTIDDSLAVMIPHIAPFYGPEVIFTSIAAEDGWVLESTATSEQGGTTLQAAGAGPLGLSVGDETTKQQYKSIVSFDTATLPPVGDAVIHAATFELVRGVSVGNITNLGTLKVDIRTFGFHGEAELLEADFQAAATATDVILNFPIPAANGDFTIGALEPAGRNAINVSGKTQFRLYFSNGDNGNTTKDLLGFYSGANGTAANRPILRVQYRQP